MTIAIAVAILAVAAALGLYFERKKLVAALDAAETKLGLFHRVEAARAAQATVAVKAAVQKVAAAPSELETAVRAKVKPEIDQLKARIHDEAVAVAAALDAKKAAAESALKTKQIESDAAVVADKISGELSKLF